MQRGANDRFSARPLSADLRIRNLSRRQQVGKRGRSEFKEQMGSSQA
uniref:Uncharacterized protein n=1 Tax=Peronospora matthiolae TaxID=2874970 RepID=A0AAV1USL4_9STRA